jgi:DNA topoisomerase VI subunit B
MGVDVTDKAIVITDNGPGIPNETVAGILDFSVRVSSREAYASPTRGAQGNALKTIIAMAFAHEGRRRGI